MPDYTAMAWDKFINELNKQEKRNCMGNYFNKSYETDYTPEQEAKFDDLSMSEYPPTIKSLMDAQRCIVNDIRNAVVQICDQIDVSLTAAEPNRSDEMHNWDINIPDLYSAVFANNQKLDSIRKILLELSEKLG